MRQTKADKAIDARINAIYCRACSGIQIDIFDISKVFAVGKQAILAGQDPESAMDAVDPVAPSASPVEPDARDYHCADCGAMEVYGLDELLARGEVEIIGRDGYVQK